MRQTAIGAYERKARDRTLRSLARLMLALSLTGGVAFAQQDKTIEAKVARVNGKAVEIDLTGSALLPGCGAFVTIYQSAEIPLLGAWRVTEVRENSVVAEPDPRKDSGQPGVGYQTKILTTIHIGIDRSAYAQAKQRIESLRGAVEAGNRDMQLLLALAYAGLNSEKARHWFQQAANNGRAEASAALARYYVEDGNYEEAERLYREAFERGDDTAVSFLDSLYRGDLADEKRANEWLKEAAQKGSPLAQRILEDMGLR